MSISKTFISIGRFIDTAAIVAGIIAISVATLTILINVFVRYFFSAGIVGVFEIGALLLPVIVFLSITLAQKRRSHIAIVLLVRHFPPRSQLRLEIATLALGLLFLSIMAWQNWIATIVAIRINACLYGITPIPLWWSKLAVAVGCSLFSLQCARDIANTLRRPPSSRGDKV